MSYAAVVPYFRARMSALTSTHREHKDPFNYANIPDTTLDRSYHIEIGDASAIAQNQTGLEYEVPVTLRVFYKGFRDVATKRTDVMTNAETILGEVLKHENRLTQTGIKNVLFSGVRMQPLNESNDNAVILILDFRVLIILDIT